jgi:hypothetical protein
MCTRNLNFWLGVHFQAFGVRVIVPAGRLALHAWQKGAEGLPLWRVGPGKTPENFMNCNNKILHSGAVLAENRLSCKAGKWY